MTKDYVARLLVSRAPGRRRVWRLYYCPGRRSPGPAEALGDFERLRQVRDSLAGVRRSRHVTACRVAPRQVAFRVTTEPQARGVRAWGRPWSEL